MNNFIEILASVLECFIFVRLFNEFLGLKNERMKFLKSSVFFALILLDDILIAQLDGFENISIIILLLIFFAYSLVFFKGKIWEKILVSVIPTITALPINLAVMGIFSAVAGNNRTAVLPGGILRIPVLFFTKAIFFFASEIVIKVRRKQPSSLTGFQWIIQISCLSFLS